MYVSMLSFIVVCVAVLILYTTLLLQVSINFTGNKAVIGSAIYTRNVALCSWSGYAPPYFYYNTSVLRWSSISFRYLYIYIVTNATYNNRDNVNTGHSVDSDNASLAVQTPAVSFVILNQTVSHKVV